MAEVEEEVEGEEGEKSLSPTQTEPSPFERMENLGIVSLPALLAFKLISGRSIFNPSFRGFVINET